MTASKKKYVRGRRARKLRAAKFVEALIEGGNATDAAASVTDSTNRSYLKVQGHRLMNDPYVKEMIEERIAQSNVSTQEIIGTLVSHMRGDLADIFPDDPVLKAARKRGVSHLIKKLERKEHFIVREEGEEPIREVVTKIEIHNAHSAAKHLTNVFGLEKLPGLNPETEKELNAMVEKLIKKAAEKGVEVTPEQARAKLTPLIQSKAIN